MAELLVKAVDSTIPNVDDDRRGSVKKGDVVSIKENGFTQVEHYHQSAYPYSNTGKFVVVKCPQVTVEQCLEYREQWWKSIGWEVLVNNINAGTYQIKAYENNVSVSGENSLTRAQVEKFLEDLWRCVIDSIAFNEVVFTLDLWDSVRSPGFWGPANIDFLVQFQLVSYDSSTGVAVIDADCTNAIQQGANKRSIELRIEENGGVVNSWTGNVVRFAIDRSILLQAFRDDVARRYEKVHRKRIWYFEESRVDQVIAEGGETTITATQLLNLIRSRLDE